MGNLLIVEPSLSDAGDLYAVTSAHSEAPATNLQTTQPKEVTETTSVTGSFSWSIDLNPGAAGGASASEYDFIALWFTNLTASATWGIETSSTTAATGFSDLLTTTTFRASGQTGYERPHGFYHHTTTIDDRWLRITIADSGNSDGVIRLGRLYVAKAYQPTTNADVGLEIGFDDISPIEATGSGETIATVNEPIPSIGFTLTATGSAAWAEVQANLYELFRKRGASRDVGIVLDPEDASYAGRGMRYGRLQSRLRIARPAPFQTYQTLLELRGMI